MKATNGEIILKLPGNLCQFDGEANAYVYQSGALFKYNILTNERLWSIKANIHHALRFDKKNQRLYFFEREIFYHSSKPYLGLVIKAVDVKDGQGVFEWKSSEHLTDISNLLLLPIGEVLKLISDYDHKIPDAPVDTRLFFQANQIEIVAENHPLLAHDSQVQEGDLLITAMDSSSVLRVRPESKKVHLVLKIPNSLGQIHTVTFPQRDSVLSFINSHVEKPKSSVAIMLDLSNLDRVQWQFPAQLTDQFYSSYLSSVQLINPELFLIVDNTAKNESYIFADHKARVIHRLPSIGNRKIYQAIALHQDELKDFLGFDLKELKPRRHSKR